MKRKLAFLMATAMVVIAFAGCGQGNKVEVSGILDEVTTSDQYPIDTDVTLTYNVRMDVSQSEVMTSLNESVFAEEVMKRTGIKVEFQHPTLGQEHEAFNLMIASNDWPDIFETNWYNNPGGPTEAFDNNVIIPLNDLIEKVSPNMKQVFEEVPGLQKAVSVDGNIYCYPAYSTGIVGNAYYGVMARKDLLDELGMALPETIDEWEAALIALKDKVKYPMYLRLDPSSLGSSSNLLIGAYGVAGDLYVDDGKVKYGPYEEGFKAWISKMADWYKKGLINPDFASLDSNALQSNFVNGEVGFVAGSIGSNFGTWLPVLAENVPSAEVAPLKYPVLNKGEYPQFGQKNSLTACYGASISAQCENIEVAARFLDYGYSEEGALLYNLGIEGVTYEVKADGEYSYLPMVSDSVNLTGKSMANTLANYSRVVSSAPKKSVEAYTKAHLKDYYALPVQMEAATVWPATDADKHQLPMLPIPSEETDKISAILSDVRTFVDENAVNMINGVSSLDTYDSFVEGIKGMGIDEVLDIYQKAYDAYMQD